ncbi:MAG: hypothetical protein R3C49_08465 [Planctomycetaceae bacterium]
MKRFAAVSVAILMFGTVACRMLLNQSAQSDDFLRPGTSAQTQEPAAVPHHDHQRQRFMRSKLNMVQKIVEGIATEDFRMIRDGGMELAALAESAAWKSAGDPFYAQYSAAFEETVKVLISAADSKSVEKATFAYVHVTISCTACHQHVRGTVRTAR